MTHPSKSNLPQSIFWCTIEQTNILKNLLMVADSEKEKHILKRAGIL
jgi:hypothetical protein